MINLHEMKIIVKAKCVGGYGEYLERIEICHTLKGYDGNSIL